MHRISIQQHESCLPTAHSLWLFSDLRRCDIICFGFNSVSFIILNLQSHFSLFAFNARWLMSITVSRKGDFLFERGSNGIEFQNRKIKSFQFLPNACSAIGSAFSFRRWTHKHLRAPVCAVRCARATKRHFSFSNLNGAAHAKWFSIVKSIRNFGYDRMEKKWNENVENWMESSMWPDRTSTCSSFASFFHRNRQWVFCLQIMFEAHNLRNNNNKWWTGCKRHSTQTETDERNSGNNTFIHISIFCRAMAKRRLTSTYVLYIS